MSWMMRPTAVRAGLSVVSAAGVLLAAGCDTLNGWTSQDTAPVIIGVDLNLTGRGPGLVYDNGLRLALEQVTEQQLTGDLPLELRVLDNRGDPATAAENLTRLAADPAVAAIITAGCPQCVIDVAATLSVPVIALESQDAVAAPADQRRWIFRLGPNAADNADLLSLAMASGGIETVGVIAADDAYGEEGLRWVTAAAERDGMRVVTTSALAAAADEPAVAAAARALADWSPPQDPFAPAGPDPQPETGPDGVVVWTYAPQAAELATALREAGYNRRLYVDMVAADELFLSGAGSALDGTTLVFTTTPAADQRIAGSPAAEARRAWVLAYISRYETYHLHSTWAADALLVIANAIGRGGTAQRAAIRDRIESTRLDGITGPIRFTGEQHSGLSPNALEILTATGDRWQ